MSVITRMRRQTAVWWARTDPDEFGRYSFQYPVEIKCRWDDSVQEILLPNGEKTSSRAVVYVDRIMSVGDRLRRGSIESDEPIDPLSIADTYEIRRFDQNPNFKATETLLTAFL